MSRLCVKNVKPGVVVEIGPDVRVTACVDRRGFYLAIDAPRELQIKRVDPGTTHNGVARVCPRCTAAVRKDRKRCGACGKDMGGDDDAHQPA